MSGPWTPPAGGRPAANPRRTWVVLVVLLAAGVAFLVHTNGLSRYQVAYVVVLIPSIILHEVSHGFVANLLGDDTAKRAGRLTLNPLPHIDPLGSVVLPALLILSGSPVAFGWAKPVPVNVAKLRHPRNDSVWVSLAGPATNAVLFVAAALLFRYFLAHQLFLSPGATELPYGYEFLLAAGLANVAVGVFNLIPLPPLDGSAVVERLVPDRHLAGYYRIRPYGMLIVFLFALFVLRGSAGGHLFSGELRLWGALSGVHL
ncbi:MAG TPA: site-2 protease family protein [Acidimicrobiales bacterium]|nr:site-2 protease family protein [Acidimicrobiales bacterium]